MPVPDLAVLAERFRTFAATSASRAPLYQRLSLGIADDPELLALLRTAPEQQAIPVLLFAATHHLLLSGDEHPVAGYYPSLTEHPHTDDPVPAWRDFALSRADRIEALVATRSTQTNEVGRCAWFVPALGLLDGEVGPLAMVDVGTSAGLNLQLPRYRYEYTPGGVVGGASPVHLECGTHGDPPIPLQMPRIAAAIGIDASPITTDDTDGLRWLQACVWPDQADRFHRLAAAIDMARAVPLDVRAGDAVADLADVVGEAAQHGHPVVVNSWVLNYLSPAQRLAYVAELDSIGASNDVSWVLAESPAETPELPIPTTAEPEQITVLSVVRWRGGTRHVHRLATTHPHGYWLRWEAGQAPFSG